MLQPVLSVAIVLFIARIVLSWYPQVLPTEALSDPIGVPWKVLCMPSGAPRYIAWGRKVHVCMRVLHPEGSSAWPCLNHACLC